MVKDGAQPQKSNTLRKYLAEDVIYYELWIIDASLIRRVGLTFISSSSLWPLDGTIYHFLTVRVAWQVGTAQTSKQYAWHRQTNASQNTKNKVSF